MPTPRSGLARIVVPAAEREYNLAQFLGEAPATVPPVITSDLRNPIDPQTGRMRKHGISDRTQ